jgi:two-component system response regulator (stage 0 sporulation protein F)
MVPNRKTKILVVEDDNLFLWTLNCFLQKEGYEVFTAANAESAIDAARQQSFDIVISDFHLPGLNGRDLMRKVRSVQPATKRILISAYQPEEIENRDPALLSAYLNKPIELKSLKKLLQDLSSS